MLRSMLCASVLLAGLTALGVAGETKQAAGKGGEIKIESKATIVDPVPKDLAKSLGLSLPSVGTLAARICEARKAPDPVALALLAHELAVLEKVADKKADLTAETLQKEAVDLVKLRGMSQELAAVSEICKGDDVTKELDSLAEEAKKSEAEQKQAFDQGEQPRGMRFLTVRNHTDNTVRVHVHGAGQGFVLPHSSHTFSVPGYLHHIPNINLHASTDNGGDWRSDVYGQYNQYTWNLYP